MCDVHDDDVGGEGPLSKVGEAEGLVRPKGVTAREHLKEGQKRKHRGKVHELDLRRDQGWVESAR